MNISQDAEMSVLGCLMIGGNFHLIDNIITAESFGIDIHKTIFTAISELAKKNFDVDVVTVSERVESNTGQVIDDIIGDIVDTVPSFGALESYARIVAEKASLRALEAISYKSNVMIQEGCQSAEVADYISSEILAMSTGSSGMSGGSIGAAIKKLLGRTEDRLEGRQQIIKTGFRDLDDILKLEPGRLIVVAGRPAMGKSTFTQNICDYLATNGTPALIESLEMPEEEVAARSLCAAASINPEFFSDPLAFQSKSPHLSEQSWSALSTAVNIRKDLPIQVNYSPGAKISEIKNRARAFFATQEGYTQKGVGMLMIDYLQLMRMTGINKANDIADITSDLKAFAGEMNLVIVLLSQLNRELEKRPNKRPICADLRDSGAIEQDADAVLFCYRDEVYFEDTPDKGMAEIIVGKNRMGPLATVRLKSTLQHYRFENILAKY